MKPRKTLVMQFKVLFLHPDQNGTGSAPGWILSPRSRWRSPRGVHWLLVGFCLLSEKMGKGHMRIDFFATCPCDKAHKRKWVWRGSKDLWFSLSCPPQAPQRSGCGVQHRTRCGLGEHDPWLLMWLREEEEEEEGTGAALHQDADLKAVEVLCFSRLVISNISQRIDQLQLVFSSNKATQEKVCFWLVTIKGGYYGTSLISSSGGHWEPLASTAYDLNPAGGTHANGVSVEISVCACVLLKRALSCLSQNDGTAVKIHGETAFSLLQHLFSDSCAVWRPQGGTLHPLLWNGLQFVV